MLITDDAANRPPTTAKLTIGATAAPLIASGDASKNFTRGVQLKADSGNGGTIYIGRSTVTANSAAATDGYPLAAGETFFVPESDLSLVYAIGSIAGLTLWMFAI